MAKQRHKIQRTLADTFLLFSTGITLFAVLLTGIIYISLEFADFNKEADKFRIRNIEDQRERIKFETEKVIEYIDFTRMFLEDNMRNELKSYIDQAYGLMHNIYYKNRDHLSDEEIKALIKNALRPIRFNNGRGYYFIVSLNGVEELYPVAPQYEGENLLQLQDEKGNFVIRDELDVVNNYGEGFVTDYWTKPDADPDSLYPKTSFVKVFEPLNWYVGCGEYLDNVEKDMQKDVMQRIANIRFGKDGYIFVNSFDGHAVVIDSPDYKAGDYLGDIVHEDGVNHIQQQLEKAFLPEGGYIEYLWPKPGHENPLSKLSYVNAYDPWNWIIGAGVYVDDVDIVLQKQRDHLYGQVRLKVFFSIVFMVVLFGIVFFIANNISKKLKSNFDIFISRFRNAVRSGEPINSDEFSLKDIALINKSINDVIADKFRAETLLRENEARFRTIVENIPVMIAVLDKNMVKKFWNKLGRETFELDLVERFDLSMISPLLNDDEDTKANFRKFSRFDGVFREIKMKLKGKSVIHNWATFKTEENEIILVGYDMTTIRENQQMLKELNETKDKFFRIISHDLQAPFNAIIGFSDVLQNDDGSLEMSRRMDIIRMINNSAQSMHRLLINLLNWARSQSGQIEVQKTSFDLCDLVSEVNTFCDIQCTEKGLSLNNLVPAKTFVYADKSMTETVIRNFISNSIKYTETGGFIEVGCAVEDDFVRIRITDSGVGIPEDQIGNLFILSKAKQRAGTNNEAGTGLGLLICHDFVHRMGGDITVESVVGQGTSFYFTLPHAH